MYSKMLILRFPKEMLQTPFVCNLVRDFDLTFNILNAEIDARKEGMMVLRLIGTPQNFRQGVKYLKDQGIQVESTEEQIRRSDDICIQCGACTAVCPTGALSVKTPEMEVIFDQEKCSVCKLCIPACPPHAMVLRPTDEGPTL
ncbi:MAG: NIL domain-containing protein [Desulfatibacillaceae bacterium]